MRTRTHTQTQETQEKFTRTTCVGISGNALVTLRLRALQFVTIYVSGASTVGWLMAHTNLP